MRANRSFRRVLFIATLCLPLPLYAGACEDPFGEDLILQSDTVRLAAPTVDSSRIGSAVDLANANLVRFPERPVDALQWDLALRLRDGELFLRPIPTNSNGFLGARIGESTRAYDDVSEAPDRGSAYDTVEVRVETGRTYVTQSRQWSNGVELCRSFSKLKAVETSPALGTARFAVTTNRLCSDRRLER